MLEILDLLSNDLIKVCVCLSILGISYLSNVILSLFFNIKITNQKLDKSKLLQGILKLIVLIVGTACLVVSIDLAIYVFGIDTDTGNAISIVAVIGTIGVAAFKYIKEAYDTFLSIINYEKVK